MWPNSGDTTPACKAEPSSSLCYSEMFRQVSQVLEPYGWPYIDPRAAGAIGGNAGESLGATPPQLQLRVPIALPREPWRHLDTVEAPGPYATADICLRRAVAAPSAATSSVCPVPRRSVRLWTPLN
jgi:hypothetical protein